MNLRDISTEHSSIGNVTAVSHFEESLQLVTDPFWCNSCNAWNLSHFVT